MTSDDCIACGGTGMNSKGGECYPCKVSGRVGPPVLYAAAFKGSDGVKMFAGPYAELKQARRTIPPEDEAERRAYIIKMIRKEDGSWKKKPIGRWDGDTWRKRER